MTDLLDFLRTLVTILNSLSTVGLLGGMSYIVYLALKNKKNVKVISDNHLSGLPEMNETLKRIEGGVNALVADSAYIKGRLNGVLK